MQDCTREDAHEKTSESDNAALDALVKRRNRMQAKYEKATRLRAKKRLQVHRCFRDVIRIDKQRAEIIEATATLDQLIQQAMKDSPTS